jgi:hypothetical protein
MGSISEADKDDLLIMAQNLITNASDWQISDGRSGNWRTVAIKWNAAYAALVEKDRRASDD